LNEDSSVLNVPLPLSVLYREKLQKTSEYEVMIGNLTSDFQIDPTTGAPREGSAYSNENRTFVTREQLE
jgi:hypothetical protein